MGAKVAVIAHARKTFGDGLAGLRRELQAQGVADPLWLEVEKSKQAPSRVEQALESGAELIFAWGGDGTVQRCLGVVAGSEAALAIVPAGTANLFATNLDIPQDIEQAVRIGLEGKRRRLDVGRVNGERFGVMAGAGFDASMIHGAGRSSKERFGRAAYVWTGARSLRAKPFTTRIAVDGNSWFKGDATCVLVGNVGRLFGGVQVFQDAEPDDGHLEIGVVTADSLTEWARTLARTAVGQSERSPLVRSTSAKKIDVELDRKVRYELDGGDRVKVKSLKIRVEPKAVTVCVPEAA
jgi:diacylglycerol kinase (ATP)